MYTIYEAVITARARCHRKTRRLYHSTDTWRLAHTQTHLGFIHNFPGSSSSRNEYYLGGIIALLLQDHRTISTKSVCSSQYMVTDQHWATVSDPIRMSNKSSDMTSTRFPWPSRRYFDHNAVKCFQITKYPSRCGFSSLSDSDFL